MGVARDIQEGIDWLAGYAPDVDALRERVREVASAEDFWGGRWLLGEGQGDALRVAIAKLTPAELLLTLEAAELRRARREGRSPGLKASALNAESEMSEAGFRGNLVDAAKEAGIPIRGDRGFEA